MCIYVCMCGRVHVYQMRPSDTHLAESSLPPQLYICVNSNVVVWELMSQLWGIICVIACDSPTHATMAGMAGLWSGYIPSG